MINNEMKNKVVVITGGNKGIGKGCAKVFKFLVHLFEKHHIGKDIPLRIIATWKVRRPQLNI